MNNPRVAEVHDHSHCHKSISWSAILAGGLVGVGLSFLVNLFGVAIGLTAFSVNEGSTTLAVGGFIGLVVGSIVSMYVTGWVAGYLGRRPFCEKHHIGEIYGFTAWCVTLILSIFLASHAGNLINNYNYMTNPASDMTPSVSTTTRDNAPMVSERKVGGETTHVTIQTEKAAGALGIATFVTFFLFFIGALAACFGGFCAMGCSKNRVGSDNCVICKTR